METMMGLWCVVGAGILSLALASGDVQPEQIHLAYGKSPDQMVVTWVTSGYTDSIVEYGLKGLVLKEMGVAIEFRDGGPEQRLMYIHRVTLKNLDPGERYEYHCGGPKGWSGIYFFTAMPLASSSWAPRLAIYGDMGAKNAQSLSRLQEETQHGNLDAIFHVGDFAYDMHTDNARVGDQFMRQIETIAAYIPYMTCVGNHEAAYNFSNYVNRFSMPGDGDHRNLWYSFNIGHAHIIALSTEVYFSNTSDANQVSNQLRWLEQDLISATTQSNREERPWIITMGHRPMYCSNNKDGNCDGSNPQSEVSIVRKALEDLFFKYGVDLAFWGHLHSYERSWPMHDFKVMNGSISRPYNDAPAPIHIIAGSAGCDENRTSFIEEQPDWSASRANDYGYTKMTIHNGSHLYCEQISDDKNGSIIDHFWVTKTKQKVVSPVAEQKVKKPMTQIKQIASDKSASSLGNPGSSQAKGSGYYLQAVLFSLFGLALFGGVCVAIRAVLLRRKQWPPTAPSWKKIPSTEQEDEPLYRHLTDDVFDADENETMT